MFCFLCVKGVQLAWSTEGLVLAVGGYKRLPDLSCESWLHFYTKDGQLLLASPIPKVVCDITVTQLVLIFISI